MYEGSVDITDQVLAEIKQVRLDLGLDTQSSASGPEMPTLWDRLADWWYAAWSVREANERGYRP